MAQLQRIDACHDTLSDKLCQVNTHVGCIARCQAEMGSYTMPSTLVASVDESDDSDDVDDAADDDAIASEDDDDGDASSSSTNEMST